MEVEKACILLPKKIEEEKEIEIKVKEEIFLHQKEYKIKIRGKEASK